MKSTYIRNYLVFIAISVFFAGALLFVTHVQKKGIQNANAWVAHTKRVISKDLDFKIIMEDLLAAQRNYLNSGEKTYLDKITSLEKKIQQDLYELETLVADDPIQVNRAKAMSSEIKEFKIDTLEGDWSEEDSVESVILGKRKLVRSHAQRVYDLNEKFLRNEQGKFNARVLNVLQKNDKFVKVFFIGGSAFILILLFFNSNILKYQLERLRIVEKLEQTEQRLSIAFEAMNDGIFDWDVQSNQVYYSDRFIGMLGYDPDEFTYNFAQFDALLHPDDKERVQQNVTEYLSGKRDDYVINFRMKHKNGHWVWIDSRAKAVFNKNDKAMRVIGAHRDITNIRETEKILVKQRRAAEKANRAKSDFLAHMSHEIRTPLTAVAGIAEILDEKSDGKDEMDKKLISTLRNSTESLKDLINDVLDISKIEADEINLLYEEFDLREMLQKVVDMMAVKAKDSKLKFIVDDAGLTDEQFTGDSHRLRQVMVNLIGNAIKFTDKGTITLKMYTKAYKRKCNQLVIEVKDTGIGISKENQKTIFNKFQQGDSSVSRKYGGTGLGLNISQRLAHYMGGKITLKSIDGKGATFTLSLPYAKIDTKTTFKNKVSKQKVIINNGRKHALVAEDNEANILIIDHILDELDVEPVYVNNGQKALDALEARNFDIVLMDIQMPVMDGVEATKLIRERDVQINGQPIPIIGMTAHALISEKEKALKAGMDDFVTKPFDIVGCRRHINKLLNRGSVA